MTRTILLSHQESEDKLKDYMETSVERQRYLIFSNKIISAYRIIRYETEEKLCYFSEEAKPRFGTRGFIQRLHNEGFTINKLKKNKLSIWYSKTLVKTSKGLMEYMFKDLKIDWMEYVHDNLIKLITRASLEKILNKKITSPGGILDHYMKTTVKIKGLDQRLYYNAIIDTGFDNEFNSENPHQLNLFLKFSTDPNWTLANRGEVSGKMRRWNITPILNHCKILDKKVDWSLSKEELDVVSHNLELEVEGFNMLDSHFGMDYPSNREVTKPIIVLPF